MDLAGDVLDLIAITTGLMAGTRSPPTESVLNPMVQIPLVHLQAIGLMLAIAILCLVVIVLSAMKKKGKRTPP